jgi:hypothetical protein
MPSMDDDARLEVSAALLRRLMAQADGRILARWRHPEFSRAVDVFRRQLAPIRDRATLRASYRREAGRVQGQEAGRWIEAGPSTALEVAYAMRWLELERGRPAGPFATVIAAHPSEAGRRGR